MALGEGTLCREIPDKHVAGGATDAAIRDEPVVDERHERHAFRVVAGLGWVDAHTVHPYAQRAPLMAARQWPGRDPHVTPRHGHPARGAVEADPVADPTAEESMRATEPSPSLPTHTPLVATARAAGWAPTGTTP